MKRVLLVIRDAGHDPVADIHSDEDAARRALAAYVRERTGGHAGFQAANDDGAVEAYFAASTASYSIVGVADENR